MVRDTGAKESILSSRNQSVCHIRRHDYGRIHSEQTKNLIPNVLTVDSTGDTI
uniref:Uncharacterized protein n=1 Tax=Arion vulgaris TaxID=1028688 RepID=A0A0B6ZD48_9EUPU